MSETAEASEAYTEMRPISSAMPEPPFPEGSCVRCLISTRGWYAGGELRGRAGRVVRCTYFDRSLNEPFWDILVAWDGAEPPMLFHHAPEELELVER